MATAFYMLGSQCAVAQGVTTWNAAPRDRGPASGKPFPVRFENIAPKVGLRAALISGGETTKKYIVEANGSGVAFLDFDNDGWQDVLLVNGSRLESLPSAGNYLYRNVRGMFQDVTALSGIGRSGWGNGVCVGDVNRDGFDDLYLTYWGSNSLFVNDGTGKFRDMATKAGIAGPDREWSTGCTFLDYDRDGHLDLLVSSYVDFDPKRVGLPGSAPNCEWKGMPVFCGPKGLPAGALTLYRSRGNGTFENATGKAGLGVFTKSYAFTAIAADWNDDGWTDIYVACDSSASLLFRNRGDGTFAEIGTETGVAFNENGSEQAGMGIATADFDNDGMLDLVKTNFSGDYPNLYRNLGRGIFEDVVLQAGLGVNPQYVGWGVGFADFDNDGWIDIFQANGHVFPEVERRRGGEPYKNPRLVYRNLGNRRFEDVSTLAGPGIQERASSRGVAFGDFDNDGDIDVLIMNMNEAPSLLRNENTSGHGWIKVLLQGVAAGASVVVEAGGKRQRQAVVSQSSFLSHNDRRLHFGLGTAKGVDSITAHWPSGRLEKFPAVKPNQTVILEEGTGRP